jgi:hypothetical protein
MGRLAGRPFFSSNTLPPLRCEEIGWQAKAPAPPAGKTPHYTEELRLSDLHAEDFRQDGLVLKD